MRRCSTSAAFERRGSDGRTVLKIRVKRTLLARSCSIARWADGLSGLESVSHLVVLYWMDKARRDLVRQMPRHYAESRGTFALRSPVRPNPIAVSVARLVGIKQNKLTVVGLDCLDNTPLLDLKPYFASTDSVPEAEVRWHASGKK